MENRAICGFVISGISLTPDTDEREACVIAANELKRAGIPPARIRFSIYKKSVDARKKNDVRIVYSVAARFDTPQCVKAPSSKKYKIAELLCGDLDIKYGAQASQHPPLVVGMGPSGLFCALLLAENGYEPIIIDRGDSVSERTEKYDEFFRSGILDTESNIQFGAGGAGTFSDGKLLTRINDPKIGYVLKRFCDFGAPEEILTNAKPHIGTDILLGVVENILLKIESLGGKVLYRTRLESISENSDGTVLAHTSKGDIRCSSLVLATGHSARDTYKMLLEKGYLIEAKTFSVGVRIEHLREDIDRALLGDFAGHPKLGKGEYHLSDTTGERGVYTFCMCPGGEVVAAASEEGGVVVNGMSRQARDGRNSNSAIAVNVWKNDYDGTPMGAIEFQRNIEKKAFSAGGKDYSAPIQTVGDFLEGKRGSEPSRVLPTYRDGQVCAADINNVLPDFVCRELKRGILSFERKISGFSSSCAILTAPETRTSAPVRIMRNDELLAIGRRSVYPCGEGAGYAGGITSAAIDGIRVAQKIMERFAPVN